MGVPGQVGHSGRGEPGRPKDRGSCEGAGRGREEELPAQVGGGGASGRTADRPTQPSTTAPFPARREVTDFRPGFQGRMGPAARLLGCGRHGEAGGKLAVLLRGSRAVSRALLLLTTG